VKKNEINVSLTELVSSNHGLFGVSISPRFTTRPRLSPVSGRPAGRILLDDFQAGKLRQYASRPIPKSPIFNSACDLGSSIGQ